MSTRAIPDRQHAGNITLFGKAITDSSARILASNGPGAVGVQVVGQGLVSANLALWAAVG